MESREKRVNVIKLAFYLLKYIWIILLCAVVGFIGLYYYTAKVQKDTYTSVATVYVMNGSPNLTNYQYANVNDLDSAVRLMNTYKQLLKSDRVLSAVRERLYTTYGYSNEKTPWLTEGYIDSALSMKEVGTNTSLLEIICTTRNAETAFHICNAVMDVAPQTIKDIVIAGDIAEVDRPAAPAAEPDYRSPKNRGLLGGVVGAMLAAAALALRFLLNHKVTDTESLTDQYTPPVLAEIQRVSTKGKPASALRLTENSETQQMESYARLRTNLQYTLAGKEKMVIVVTSAVSGEGKSVIAANLAISCAMTGKQVLLVDADMRQANLQEIFEYDPMKAGLSDVLVGSMRWQDAVIPSDIRNLSILPAGVEPPNPSELLGLPAMPAMLDEMQQQYDLVLLDMHPINVVADALIFPSHVAGSILAVRQQYSDHRDIRKALISCEMAGMKILGFVYGREKAGKLFAFGRKGSGKKG